MGEACTKDIEPALEPPCESTAYPALTENEANCSTVNQGGTAGLAGP